MKKFCDIQSRNELADYLGIPRSKLTHILYVKKPDSYLTFSTNDRHFVENQKKFLAEAIVAITKAGFSINEKKTRLQFRDSRQEVTGLIVNKKL